MPATGDLPSGYYLRNFRTLVEDAVGRYDDILTAPELSFVTRFASLPDPAQRLYVRLIMRKGPLFRSDKLAYDDIADIETAVAALADEGFLAVGGEYNESDSLRLCVTRELRTTFEAPRTLTKPEMLAWILEQHEPSAIRSRVNAIFTVFEPLCVDVVDKFRLLFFGNLGQDFTEFVVTELGHVRYEDYRLDRASRPFQTRVDLDAALAVHKWRVLLDECRENGDNDKLGDLAEEVQSTVWPDSAARRRDRVASAVAREFERIGDTDRAVALYELCRLPPSRERRIRILEKEGRHKQAATLLGEIYDNPLAESELVFAESFGARMHRRHGSPYVDRPRAVDPPAESVVLPQTHDHVEEAALEHMRRQGFDGAWIENALFRGLFGLGFWDIIFASVPGAFHNRFQRGPSDQFTPDFRETRIKMLEGRLDEVGAPSWSERVLGTYDEKHGVANHFVDWKRLSRDLVEAGLRRIPPEHQRAVLERMVRDLRENGSGFPDLFLYPATGVADSNSSPVGSYLLVEVKGPGDQLQKNQIRWMHHFARVGIPHAVLRVAWKE